jgi:hypothetical protein
MIPPSISFIGFPAMTYAEKSKDYSLFLRVFRERKYTVILSRNQEKKPYLPDDSALDSSSAGV